MTASPPDPEGDHTTDGFEPGEVPPSAASTSASKNPTPVPTGRVGAGSLPVAVIVAGALVFAVVAVLLVVYLAGR